jgi:hypothetical protein
MKTTIGIALFAISTVATAHHSSAQYDFQHPIEIEGKLLEVAWQNPHVHFKLQSVDKNGRAVVWDVETGSVSGLLRSDIKQEDFKVGEMVKLFGAASKRSSQQFLAGSVLRSDDQELVLLPIPPFTKPHWMPNARGLKGAFLEGGTVANSDVTIFHVWATKIGDPDSPPPFMLLGGKDYPLTQAATKALEKWDPVRNTVTNGCTPKGMPMIMNTPYPIAFVQQGDRILLRMEEYDLVRTIHMTGGAGFEKQPKTSLGYSTGRWEGRTLVITTNRIGWRYFKDGIPLGAYTVIAERFTPSANGSRLDYTMTITDPEIFTEPVELKAAWVWRPGEQVKPYNCTIARAPEKS